MQQYAICEINKKQVKVLPNKEFLVDLMQGEKKELEVNVLLLANDGKLEIGKPYLKEKITLKVSDNVKGKKIRVSKFHAKANYRRTTGIRPKFTKLVHSVKL